MPVNTPQPRLPLEPEEYPLYRPPRRIGCSGLSIVTLVLLAAFALLFWKVTPPIIKSIRSFSPASILQGDTTPVSTPGEGALETQTVVTAPPTVAAIVTPTPQLTCVKVSGTGGSGTPLRTTAKIDGVNALGGTNKLGEGAVLEVIGPDVSSGKDKSGLDIVWMHVRLPGDGRNGYALGKYLQPAPCP